MGCAPTMITKQVSGTKQNKKRLSNAKDKFYAPVYQLK